MTEDYVTSKIKEALKVSEDDVHAAQKLLITWAVRDPALLIGLAKPHLKAIVASRIDLVRRAPKKQVGEKTSHFSRQDVNNMIAESPFGEKRSGPKVPPPKTSSRQASAIHQLVAAFKRKK